MARQYKNLQALENYTRDVGWDYKSDGLTDCYKLILRHIAVRCVDSSPTTLSTRVLRSELMGLSRDVLHRALKRFSLLDIIEYSAKPGSEYFTVRFRLSKFDRGDLIQLPIEQKSGAKILPFAAGESSK